MASKKGIRADNTYMICNGTGDNPKLGAKILSCGRISLFLEFYFGYTKETSKKTGREVIKINRKREYLKLYLLQATRTPIEREQNRETLELAKRIRFERGQELLEDMEGYRLRKNRDKDFIEYFQEYIDKYNKKDCRMLNLALNRFKDFLKDTEEYSKFTNGIKSKQLTKDMMSCFAEYLQSRSKGEGAKTIYKRFKKVIKHAIEHNIITNDPCKGIVINADEQTLKKDILSDDEVQKLIETHYDNENPNIRRAFIFCLYTGLRFCDVKDLTFANVDYSNKLLKYEQNKTKGHSKRSGVILPLNNTHIKLIGRPQKEESKDDIIFKLPSHNMCLKALKHWVKKAGIDKHITWHCARHTFAVDVLSKGANIKTVADLLGHSSLEHTEKYTRAIDKQKEEALNSLTNLEITDI